uniref:Uncharacterized protein n=1 Tax=Sphaerodactylus townsendi TaxID=933632 RepID=A0ACB8E4S7_9SAUR
MYLKALSTGPLTVPQKKLMSCPMMEERRWKHGTTKRYQGRTELFHSELRKGNMSLNLKNSQLSDQGQYTCMISLGDWYDLAVIQLNMIAKGEEPSISLEHYEGNGIGLTCSSKGWYPKSQTVWLDSKGKKIELKSRYHNHRDPSWDL